MGLPDQAGSIWCCERGCDHQAVELSTLLQAQRISLISVGITCSPISYFLLSYKRVCIDKNLFLHGLRIRKADLYVKEFCNKKETQARPGFRPAEPVQPGFFARSEEKKSAPAAMLLSPDLFGGLTAVIDQDMSRHVSRGVRSEEYRNSLYIVPPSSCDKSDLAVELKQILKFHSVSFVSVRIQLLCRQAGLLTASVAVPLIKERMRLTGIPASPSGYRPGKPVRPASVPY